MTVFTSVLIERQQISSVPQDSSDIVAELNYVVVWIVSKLSPIPSSPVTKKLTFAILRIMIFLLLLFYA